MSKHEDLEPTVRSGAAENGLPEPLRQLVGHELAGCKIECLLGKGSMGAVFRGYELSLRRRVAIKVLLPKYADQQEFLDRFENEARAAAGLSSDRIVKVHRHGREGRFPFVVMELVEGGTLLQLLQQNGGKPTPIADALAQLKQACDGLLAVEEKTLVHRDIKPANIMLAHGSAGPAGRSRQRMNLKIVDFGIARPTSRDTSSTQPGTFVGSPLYASPEQCRGGTVSHLSDMYSLGSTFYHLLTGRAAAEGKNECEVIAWTMSTPCLRPRLANPDVPENVDALIARMTDRDPAKRFASFADVIDAITAIEEGSREREMDAPPRRWPLVVAGVMAVFLVGGAVLAYLLRPPIGEGSARTEVLKLAAQAQPGGALTQRRDRLRELLDRIPELCSSASVTGDIEATRKVVSDRIAGLNDLRSRSDDPAYDCDWKAALEQYATPEGEEGRVVGLANAVERLCDLGGRFATLQGEMKGARANLDSADLRALRIHISDLVESCGKPEVSALGVSVFNEWGLELKQGIDDLDCLSAIVVSEGKVEQLLADFQDGKDVSVLLKQFPGAFDFQVTPSCKEKAGALESKRGAALDLLEGTLSSEQALEAAWKQFGKDGRSIRGIGRLLQALSLARPDEADAAGPAWSRWKRHTEPREARAIGALIKSKILAACAVRKVKPVVGPIVSPGPMTPPLPKDWPREWPEGFLIPNGLTAWEKDGRRLYRFGDDPVEMVLVNDAKPFLVDVRQVTYERLCPKPEDRLLGSDFWRGSAKVNPDLKYDERLVVVISGEEAAMFADRVKKDLMTEAEWNAVLAALGSVAPDKMVELAGKVVDAKKPLAYPWPGPVPRLAGFEVGVREIIRVGNDFQAVGHSLFEPLDAVSAPILKRAEQLRYYGLPAPVTKLPRTARQRQLGFRCVLRLQRWPQ